MIKLATASLAAVFLLHSPVSAQQTSEAATEINSLSDLPVAEAAAARCGVAFAMIEGLQKAGAPGIEEWPSIESINGKEYFVQTVAKMIEERGWSREKVMSLVQKEADILKADLPDRLNELRTACLAMKESSGL